MLPQVTPDVSREPFPIAPMFDDAGRYDFPAIAVSSGRAVIQFPGNVGLLANCDRKQRAVPQCRVPTRQVAGAGIDPAVTIYAVQIVQIAQDLSAETGEGPSETEYAAAQRAVPGCKIERGAAIHAQPVEDFLLHEIRIGQSSDTRQDHLEQRVAGVIVCEFIAGPE